MTARAAGSRRGRATRWLLITVVVLLVAAGLLFWRMRWETRHTFLLTTTHETAELKDEFRLLQVSDFHNLPDAGQVDHIIDLARQARPDAVAITGDLINTVNDDLDSPRQLVRGLVGLGVPVYYVDGNHDHWSDSQPEEHAMLREHGVEVLSNETRAVEGRWGTLQLVFVDDYYTERGDLEAALRGVPEDGFRFAVTHSPQIFDSLNRHGIDYAICGHTHGGQLALPFIGAVMTPGGGLFPTLDKGMFRDGDATLFIDSGIGTTGPELRLMNQSQVVLHSVGPAAGR